MGMKDKLPTLTAAKAIELLAANGNLIKRPFLLGTGFGLVGFNESAWAAAFALP
jgi:arsenate reductase